MNEVTQSPAIPLKPVEPSRWRVPLLVVTLSIVGILLVFYSTAEAMVDIWSRSGTFAHGYMIVPITLWLVWRKRAVVAALNPTPNLLGLVPLAVVALGWSVANVAGVGVVQQLALVTLVIAVVWTVLGTRVVFALAFPLFFLYFAVPMGEGLVPPLRAFTADFTVKLVELTGIPIYREGTFFELPSGNWSVVEGCSGVRYLIASVTLGTLYAYLTYTSLSRRLIFIVASFAVPVIANGLRAFMIVMIGHFSDMQYAVGVDHLIYGWVFFGIVIGLMFFVGSYWRQDEAEPAVATSSTAAPTEPKRFWVVGVVGLLAVGVWPGLLTLRPSVTDAPISVNLVAPAIDGWEKAEGNDTDWEPNYSGMDATLHATYVKGDRRIGVFIFYFARQVKGAELISSTNVLVVEKHPVWQEKVHRGVSYMLAGAPEQVEESVLRSAAQNLYVVNWNWITGTNTTNPYLGKLLQAKARLLGGTSASAAVILYSPFDGEIDVQAAPMQTFINDALPAIESSLNAAAEGR